MISCGEFISWLEVPNNEGKEGGGLVNGIVCPPPLMVINSTCWPDTDECILRHSAVELSFSKIFSKDLLSLVSGLGSKLSQYLMVSVDDSTLPRLLSPLNITNPP